MLRRPLETILSTPSLGTRCGFFHTGTIRQYAAQLPPRIVIKEDEIEESFLKGSGPGGQKINKTSSAVQLKHLPTGMVVKSQATRSRSQNRSIARRLLADKLEDAEKGPESRTALKDEIKRKKKASKSKKARRKHKTSEDNKEDEKADGQHENT
ncbi:MAG: hypothetical protein LQ350_003765 [Teloschistes chrysophthalmus]|nr:MAG: hypothetical protein LQ350_003765 [Niorma chrysophthalma]